MTQPEVKPQPAGLPALPELHAELLGVIPYAPADMHAFHKNGMAGADPKRLFASACVLAMNSTQNTAKLEAQLQTFRIALTVLALRQGGVLQIQEREANKVPSDTELVMQIVDAGLLIKATVPRNKIILASGE